METLAEVSVEIPLHALRDVQMDVRPPGAGRAGLLIFRLPEQENPGWKIPVPGQKPPVHGMRRVRIRKPAADEMLRGECGALDGGMKMAG